jgi:hypothetical protein
VSQNPSAVFPAVRGTPPTAPGAEPGGVSDRFLVQVAVLRPQSGGEELAARIRELDHGQVRALEHVLNVWLHVDAEDRDAAVARVREQLDERLDPAERQQVLAVVAFRQR